MKKISSKLFVLFVLTTFVLSACAGTGSGGSSGGGDLEGALSIVSWAGYIERGETDPNFGWVTQFETETGCIVTNKTVATSDEMVALMNEGGCDLVTACGDASN